MFFIPYPRILTFDFPNWVLRKWASAYAPELSPSRCHSNPRSKQGLFCEVAIPHPLMSFRTYVLTEVLTYLLTHLRNWPHGEMACPSIWKCHTPVEFRSRPHGKVTPPCIRQVDCYNFPGYYLNQRSIPRRSAVVWCRARPPVISSRTRRR